MKISTKTLLNKHLNSRMMSFRFKRKRFGLVRSSFDGYY